MSAINAVLDAVADLMGAAAPGWTISRGALGTDAMITCEIGPSTPDAIYMDKNTHVPLDVAINGKSADLYALSEAMNNIHSALTRMTVYPSGRSWQITDITNYTLPQVIGREDNNMWLMASALSVRFFWRGE